MWFEYGTQGYAWWKTETLNITAAVVNRDNSMLLCHSGVTPHVPTFDNAGDMGVVTEGVRYGNDIPVLAEMLIGG